MSELSAATQDTEGGTTKNSRTVIPEPEVDQLAIDLYERVLRRSLTSLREASDALGVPAEKARDAMATLQQLRLVREISDCSGNFAAVSPHAAEVELVAPLEADIHQRQQDLADARSKMQLMAEVFNAVRESRKREDAVVLAETAEEVRLRLADAARHCRSEVLTMQPGGARDPEQLDEARPRDLEMLRRGIDMKILYQHTARPDPATRDYVRSIVDTGAQVRTSDEVFDRLIIFDGNVAFLPHETESGNATAAIVYDQAIVGFLSRIYHHIWRSAQSFDVAEVGYGSVFDDLKLSMLELLAAGLKDDVIARRLGMSPRTCRRHISTILTTLRADSRFQAGVAAAKAGLINDD